MKTKIIALFFIPVSVFAGQYQGSSQNEIISVLRDQAVPAQLSPKAKQELEVYRKNGLPQYAPFATETIVTDAIRTLNDVEDYYPRLEKRIHGNGICFTGVWQMNARQNPYTGYFASGSTGLFVGRASTTTNGTTSGQPRTFGFAGKIFPTLDSNQVVQTENFFTVDTLLGSRIERFSEVKLSNKPVVFGGVYGTDWKFVLKALQVNKWFKKADVNPNERPVANIARMGLTENQRMNSPAMIELSVSPETPTHKLKDFREELNLKHYPKGLVLFVKAGADKNTLKTIGQITLEESFISYGCDRQLHFAHPKAE